MSYRQLAWAAGIGFSLLIAIIQPWNHTDTVVTTHDIDGEHRPAKPAPDDQNEAGVIIDQTPFAMPVASAAPPKLPGIETEIDFTAVYTALFSANPQARSDALDLIAQQPEIFSSQDRYTVRLEDMTADYQPEVAEQAALVLMQLMGTRARVEATIPLTSAAWTAARTTLPEMAVSVAPDFVSDEAIDAELTNEAAPLADTRPVTLPDRARMTMAADTAVSP